MEELPDDDDEETRRKWSTLIVEYEESLFGISTIKPEIVYTENRRYFADQEFRRTRHKPDQNMVEYWVPPEKTGSAKKSIASQGTGGIPPKKMTQIGPSSISSSRGGKGPKIPKVKEPRDGEKTSKKSSSDYPPSPIRLVYWKVSKYFQKIGRAANGSWQKFQLYRNRLKTNKVAPIHTKVQARHLELEPLCCLSSCLVRGAVTTVVVFELCYIVATALCILEAMWRKKFRIWDKLPTSPNLWLDHQIFYYSIAFYNILLFIVAIGTARALVNFHKMPLRIHFIFCFFSFFVNLFFLIITIWTLASSGPLNFNFTYCLLIFCFFFQLPLQLWAATVVRSCRDFFALIHVFVSLAES